MKFSSRIITDYHEMDEMLSELTGLDAFSFLHLRAHGELAGLMIIKQYHLLRNDTKRTKIIVPTKHMELILQVCSMWV